MPTLLETVRSATDRFDPNAALRQYPWFHQDNLDCIISPDADGQLCGLLLANLKGWRIRGFYDGKALVIDHRVRPSDCVFVDVEIYRNAVKSFGNHMLLFNANRRVTGWDAGFANCFAINNWRSHDRRKFNRKYPFASIHFLLVILAQRHQIVVPPGAAGPLLFADGVYKLLLQYAENAWDWMRYLGVDREDNPLHALFHSPDLTIFEVMTKMIEFWERRNELSRTGHRGDRIAVTERGGDGRTINLSADAHGPANTWRYDADAKVRNEQFLTMIGELTGWPYQPAQWCWDGWRLVEFQKGICSELTNLATYDPIINLNPLSWAITGQNQCEYTLDPNGLFEAN